MKDHWRVKEQSPERSAELAEKTGLPKVVAQLLLNRGIDTGEGAEGFLKSGLGDLPGPFLMAGMEKAVARMEEALEKDEIVAVYGDYDADGVTSTALLCEFLCALGVNYTYFTPHRIRDGYGINDRAVEELGKRGASLIVSADCGISAVGEVERAKGLGIDFIITDHHIPGEEIPDAAAVVNPKQPGCKYPEKNLAGVGVAFNFALATRARLREKGFFDTREEPNMAQYLDLVALGTVADRVPLEGANRIMVREGIKKMGNDARTGVLALKKVSRVYRLPDSHDIGFRLGPRINAAGRIGKPDTAVNLLLSDSEVEATKLARMLDKQNFERQKRERTALEEAVAMIEEDTGSGKRSCVVVASPQWHPGITGPLASKLAEKYSKPVFAIAVSKEEMCKGSGRTVGGVNLYEALKQCGGDLEAYGGHAMAAGITVAAEKIEAFTEAFDKHLKANGAAERKPAGKTLDIDAVASPADLNINTVKTIHLLGPFGSGNPAPVLLVEGAKVLSHEIVKGIHLKVTIGRGPRKSPVEAMWWHGARGGAKEPGKITDIVFTPEVRTWRDKESVALRIEDMETGERKTEEEPDG